jgi:ankyrin repeat protein
MAVVNSGCEGYNFDATDSAKAADRGGCMRVCSRIRVTTLWLAALAVISGIALGASADVRLVTAAADQDFARMRTLLKQKVDVNAMLPDHSTALVWTAHWNNLEMADLLLRAGAKVNAADDDGVTPLSQAVENANLAMVEKLFKAGADPNAPRISGLTPLMTATHTANIEVVKALLDRGAKVNLSTNESKATALMWAVGDRNQGIAKLLIDAHADLHASTNKGFTPLLLAARNGDIEMAKILIAAGVNVNEAGSDGTHALPLAIFDGQGEFALFLLDQGADANGDLGGIRALHAAAGGVDLWLTEWSRRQGFAVGISAGSGFDGRRGGLPQAMRVRLVKALLAHGADVNARTSTSGMFMTYIGYPTKGAFEPFACGTGDVRGATPIWVAANTANRSGGERGGAMTGDSAEVIRVLLAAGADQRITTVDGTTPLMVAAGLGKGTFSPGLQRGSRSQSAEEAVKVLVEAGADVNAVNEADFTALHGAAFRGLDEVIEYLVAHGANINAREYKGRTPFRLAQGSKQSFQFQAYPETAEFIKKLGADTRLGVSGDVQERLRDVPAAGELHASSSR